MTRMTIVLAILMAAAVFSPCIEHASAQEAEIILESTEIFGKLQRPPVVFNHEQHMEQFSDCVECHHVYEYNNGKKENVWSGEEQSCSECHKANKDGKKLPLMEAFHEKCTGCHRQMIQEGEKSGPVMCGQCHVRRQ